MRPLPALVASCATAALAATLVAATTAAPPARAGDNVIVTMQDLQFTPATVTSPMGASVEFDNADDVETHKVVSDQEFFATSDIPASASSSVTPTWAGTFAYHCEHHPSMTGKIKIPMVIMEELVDGAKVRWAVASTPGFRTFDVQYKRNGTTTWRNLRVDTEGFKGAFRPSRNGDYKLRARAHNVIADKNSGWSPGLTVPVG